MLKTAGFSNVKSITQLEGQTFCEDVHCLDLLVFPTFVKRELDKTNLLKDYKLIIQVHTDLHYKHILSNNVLLSLCTRDISGIGMQRNVVHCTHTKEFVIMEQRSERAL